MIVEKIEESIFSNLSFFLSLSESGEVFQPFSKTVSWNSSLCLSVSNGAPGYREGLRMEARKQRPLTDLPAASPKLGQLLIQGGEHLSHADAAIPHWLRGAPSSDVPRELGTLVKSPNRKLAVLQTGLQAVDGGYQAVEPGPAT